MGGHIEAGSCDSEDISLSPSESILRIKGDTCKRVNIILTPKPNTTFNNVILYFSFLKYYSLSYIYIYIKDTAYLLKIILSFSLYWPFDFILLKVPTLYKPT